MKRQHLLTVTFALIVVLGIMFFTDYGITGLSMFDIDGNTTYLASTKLENNITLTFGSESFIPLNTFMEIKVDGKSYAVEIDKYIERLDKGAGTYNLDGIEFGSGEGYGIKGYRIVYPNITVEIKID